MKKTILSIAMLACCTLTYAQEVAYKMVTDKGVEVNVADVDYLLAADDDDCFAIVKTNSETIGNVLEVTVSEGSTGIQSATVSDKDVVAVYAANRLTLSNLRAGESISITDATGRIIYSAKANGSGMDINLEGMTAGIYMLKTTRSSMKFIKK